MQKNNSLRKHVVTGSVAVVGLVGVLVGVGGAQPSDSSECRQEPQDFRAVAAMIVGPDTGTDNCANCHTQETAVWKETHHYSTFGIRHTDQRAKDILARLKEAGVKQNRRMKAAKPDNMCLQCHYTTAMEGTRPKVKWGVTCESCHGPGKDWLTNHQPTERKPDGGVIGMNESRTFESPEGRKARLDGAAAKGMIHSQMIYRIAKNCYSCHTVPNEQLVNAGTHRAGSDFDLVAWSQGEIRHNFVSSPGAPKNPTNAPVTKERLRQLYLVGALVDLEVSLCNLMGVKEKGDTFHRAMIGRVNRARAKVDAIVEKVGMPQLAAILASLPDPVTEDTMIQAVPSELGAFARNVSEDTGLAAIDDLIPKSSEYRGTVYGK